MSTKHTTTIEWMMAKDKPIWFFADAEAYCCVMKTWTGWTFRITVEDDVIREESNFETDREAMKAASSWWQRWRLEYLPSADLNICSHCHAALDGTGFVTNIPIVRRAKNGGIFGSGSRPHAFCDGSACVGMFCFKQHIKYTSQKTAIAPVLDNDALPIATLGLPEDVVCNNFNCSKLMTHAVPKTDSRVEVFFCSHRCARACGL